MVVGALCNRRTTARHIATSPATRTASHSSRRTDTELAAALRVYNVSVAFAFL